MFSKRMRSRGDSALCGIAERKSRYRVYFTRRGLAIAILLGGGSKKTQDRDIKAAKVLAAELEKAR